MRMWYSPSSIYRVSSYVAQQATGYHNQHSQILAGPLPGLPPRLAVGALPGLLVLVVVPVPVELAPRPVAVVPTRTGIVLVKRC